MTVSFKSEYTISPVYNPVTQISETEARKNINFVTPESIIQKAQAPVLKVASLEQVFADQFAGLDLSAEFNGASELSDLCIRA